MAARKAKQKLRSKTAKAKRPALILHYRDGSRIRTVRRRLPGLIYTPAQAMARAKVDLRVWEIERQHVNAWQMGAGGGRVVQLFQVEVWLRRRAPKPLTDGLRSLIRGLSTYRPVFPRTPRGRLAGDRHLVELALFDIHLAKLAWAAETGENYDSQIARRIFENAISDLLERLRHFRVERILFPFGNDFYHSNAWRAQTEKGTPLEMDTRFAKAFPLGWQMIARAITRCLQVAPVDLIWVPGNHDPHTSFYACCVLKEHFRSNRFVRVDVSPPSRKCFEYGVNLLCFTHGSEENESNLPNIFQSEFRGAWCRTRWHEMHLGHYHTKKETKYQVADELGDCRVRRIPSLCGRDAWHYWKGYVGARRAAEAYLWSRRDAFVGQFSANAREGDIKLPLLTPRQREQLRREMQLAPKRRPKSQAI